MSEERVVASSMDSNKDKLLSGSLSASRERKSKPHVSRKMSDERRRERSRSRDNHNDHNHRRPPRRHTHQDHNHNNNHHHNNNHNNNHNDNNNDNNNNNNHNHDNHNHNDDNHNNNDKEKQHFSYYDVVGKPQDPNLPVVNDDPRGTDPTRKLTSKASSRGHGRNTESFDPASTLVRPDLRIQLGNPTDRTYQRLLKHDDVVIVPELFGREDDWSLYYKLVKEIRNLQQNEEEEKKGQ